MTDQLQTARRWAVVRLPKRRGQVRRVDSTWHNHGDALAEAMHLNLHTKEGEHVVEPA